MREYVNKNDVKELLLGLDSLPWEEEVDDIVDRLSEADVKEVVHAKWINAYPEIEPNPMFMYGICSNCKFEQGISDKLKYCPECGAKMDLD